MPYAPTVNDRSGEILAGYQINAAEIALAQKQQQAQQFAQIGTAVTQFAAMQQGGKAFKKFMGVAGPSMGISPDDLKMFQGMNDMDAYQMSSMMGPVMPAMISSTGLGNYQNRVNLANQAAANANQVPPNQRPISTGVGATQPGTSTQPPASNFLDLIPKRP